MRSTIVGGLVVVLGVGCGAGVTSAPVAAPGETSKRDDAPASPPPRAVRPGDLAVTLSGPDPIGPLRVEHLEEYPLVVEVRNATREPLHVGPALATVDVFEGAQLRAGCEGEPRAIELPDVLPPSGAVSVRMPVPCALEAPGTYDVIAELTAGEGDVREASLLDARFSGTMALHVDGAIGPYGADVVPAAPIDAPEPGPPPTPAAGDVLAEGEAGGMSSSGGL